MKEDFKKPKRQGDSHNRHSNSKLQTQSSRHDNNPFGRGGTTHKGRKGGGDSYTKAVKERDERELKIYNEEADKKPNRREEKSSKMDSRSHGQKNWSMSPQMSQLSDAGEVVGKHFNKETKKRLYIPESLPPFYLQSRYSPSWGPEDKKVKKEGDAEGNQETKAEDAPKDKPNFEVTGKLMEDTNKIKGVIIKYNEPPEARVPKKRWRLYPFKAGEPLPVLHIHRQSAFMCGRDRRVSEIPLDHPSCSKQHAVVQFRSVTCSTGPDPLEPERRVVKPYVIDLGSANGTYLNNGRLDPERYYELMERDVLKFGFSTREYVLLHEHSDQADPATPATPTTNPQEGGDSTPDYAE